MSSLPGYETTEEAARRLGVAMRTIYNYRREWDDFPEPVRVGRTLQWPVKPLDNWRREHPPRKLKKTRTNQGGLS